MWSFPELLLGMCDFSKALQHVSYICKRKPLVSVLSAWECFWVVEITVSVGSGVDMSLNLVKIICLFTGISSCELHSVVLLLGSWASFTQTGH